MMWVRKPFMAHTKVKNILDFDDCCAEMNGAENLLDARIKVKASDIEEDKNERFESESSHPRMEVIK